MPLSATDPLPPPKARHAGFSLIEVLVAVLIASIGVLGLVGMQATSIVTTQAANARSMVALQASSLASAMHGNRGYWATSTVAPSISMAGTNVSDPQGVLNAASKDCSASSVPSGGACTPTQLAAYDLQTWSAAMNGMLPTYSASISCSTDATVAITCLISILWTERYVSVSQGPQANSASTGGTRTFILYVEP